MSSSSVPDPELDEFLEDVLEENEDEIKAIIEWELDQMRDLHNNLPDDEKGEAELSASDLLPKIDDLVDRLLDWWLDRNGNDDSDIDIDKIKEEFKR